MRAMQGTPLIGTSDLPDEITCVIILPLPEVLGGTQCRSLMNRRCIKCIGDCNKTEMNKLRLQDSAGAAQQLQ